MSTFLRSGLVVLSLFCLGTVVGCGGPEQATEEEGMMDDMSAFDAEGSDPSALEKSTRVEEGTSAGTPEATPEATP